MKDNEENKIDLLLDLIETGTVRADISTDMRRQVCRIANEGFGDWYESWRRWRFSARVGVATLIVTFFVSVAVLRFTPSVEVGAVDRASSAHRAEIIMSINSILNQQ